jgi:hypothetical protein
MVPNSGHFSLPLCLALGVLIWSVCESGVSDEAQCCPGTVIMLHSFSHVLEQDWNQHGFVNGNFLLLLQGCLKSSTGSSQACIFTPDTVRDRRSSVWVETSE